MFSIGNSVREGRRFDQSCSLELYISGSYKCLIIIYKREYALYGKVFCAKYNYKAI